MSTTSYAHAGPSGLTADGLDLQTSGGLSANPRFFEGFMTTPRPVAASLLAVVDVARTRYFHRLAALIARGALAEVAQ
ncbi:hypothetical protein CS0771_54290 [Catellatospora sp. IY07-71]|uniref:hypothetical protein n=1 Tax=Catellatospora sp. IY07-71 TaxID=2728827 RepID=UPI001BB38010|nr:hypothetical protein [Catellatospora sp. IY07-71]BCJ75885.1 hypothetical protein CS0771_54290 [Catellatospora sp. IY07-71]